jgi:hypothetical protein
VIPYPTSAPPCHASELRISQGRGGAAAGTLYERLVFTNTGRRACLLRGYPTINALGPGGSRRTLHPHHEGFTFFYLVPANLPPGGHSFIGLATGDGCDNGTKTATIYRQLSVTIAQAETVEAGAGVRITEVCGLFVSGFGLPARYTPPAPAPGTPATATVRVDLPASVRAGTILHYTIILANPTKTTIMLRPCPGYSEGLYASGLVVRRSLELNCDNVHTIGADQHVRYAMELTLPSRAAAGIAKFSWSLNEPHGALRRPHHPNQPPLIHPKIGKNLRERVSRRRLRQSSQSRFGLSVIVPRRRSASVMLRLPSRLSARRQQLERTRENEALNR